MTGYTKLFGEIVNSTVWREPNHVRLVWITMLAMKDQYHHVRSSIPGLADAARVSLEEVEDALERLMSPDEYSRTKDYDGRRICEIDGGWEVLNGEKYRDLRNEDERREYKAEWARKKRAAEAAKRGQKRGQMSTKVDTVDLSEQNRTEQNKNIPQEKAEKLPKYRPELHNFVDEGLFKEFLTHRGRQKASNTDYAITLLTNKLVKAHEAGFDCKELIDTAIERGWKTIFLPDQPKNQKAVPDGVVEL